MPLDVAVFCKNEERHIGRCLEGLRAQASALEPDLLPLRAAVLENGSSDRTSDVARRKALDLVGPGIFEVKVYTRPAPGKTAVWNKFLSLAKSTLVGFMDADVVLSPGAIARLAAVILQDPLMDIAGAVPKLAPDFSARGFWQSVFAVPYRDLRPAPSLTGSTYLARRASLSALPSDVVNEDLHLALRHSGSVTVCRDIFAYITPPESLALFVCQRARVRRADLRERKRYHSSIANHRRRSLADAVSFLRAAGPFRLAAFLAASALATLLARLPAVGDRLEAEWGGEAAKRIA